ncbi:MAG: hypothetical protein Q7S22_05285 [Candidatus Micrarchaeota archaeon]|nr:hypothetical protein [Candidatus Micrarchaeota archaeon]
MKLKFIDKDKSGIARYVPTVVKLWKIILDRQPANDNVLRGLIRKKEIDIAVETIVSSHDPEIIRVVAGMICRTRETSQTAVQVLLGVIRKDVKIFPAMPELMRALKSTVPYVIAGTILVLKKAAHEGQDISEANEILLEEIEDTLLSSDTKLEAISALLKCKPDDRIREICISKLLHDLVYSRGGDDGLKVFETLVRVADTTDGVTRDVLTTKITEIVHSKLFGKLAERNNVFYEELVTYLANTMKIIQGRENETRETATA